MHRSPFRFSPEYPALPKTLSLILLIQILPSAGLAQSDEFLPVSSVGNQIFTKNKPNSNYFLFFEEPVKFELSMKSKLFAEAHERDGKPSFEHVQGFFGYTQSSWWDLYKPSAPFLESNYEPEVFIRYNFEGSPHSIQGGLVHQSNGKEGTQSRSWNRIYVQPKLRWGRSTDVFVKLWAPVFGDLDDNPDITDFIGYGELSVISSFKARIEGIIDYLADGTLELRARKGLSSDWSKGSLQFGISWGPFISASERLREGSSFFMALYAQYFVGYGESLIMYNVSVKRFRVGISFGFE